MISISLFIALWMAGGFFKQGTSAVQISRPLRLAKVRLEHLYSLETWMLEANIGSMNVTCCHACHSDCRLFLGQLRTV